MPDKLNQQRRDFLHTVSAAGVLLASGFPLNALSKSNSSSDPWNQAQEIIDRLTPLPSFRPQDFLITEFGAKVCTLTSARARISHDEQAVVSTPAAQSPDCYAAIAAAIAACHNAGGGRVVIPSGNWYCAGPMVLLSNVHVHLQAGAHIYFSNNPADYAKYGQVDCGANGKLAYSRWQSNDCLNYSSMVYAYGQNNIALTAEDSTCILNGQAGLPFSDDGQCWWSWKGGANKSNPAHFSQNTVNPLNPTSLGAIAGHLPAEQIALIEGKSEQWRTDAGLLPAMSEAGVPVEQRVFGIGHYLRPPMVQLIGCTKVLLQGYQTTNTPFWQHHPVKCRELVVRNVYVNSLGPNNDGVDPDSCDGVLIDGCQFNTGDDCIAIKSGKNLDTEYGPTRNIVIQNCTMQSGHGAITLGSEMSGGIENIYAQNLVFENRNWKTNPLNSGIRLKTNMNRGGYLRNLYVRNIKIPNGISTVGKFYRPLEAGQFSEVATVAGGVITIDCDYAAQEDNVRTRTSRVSNIHITGVAVGNVSTPDGLRSCYQALVIQGPVSNSYNGADKVPLLPVSDVFIDDCNFGTAANAARPLYLFNAKNIKLHNVTIATKKYNATLEVLP